MATYRYSRARYRRRGRMSGKEGIVAAVAGIVLAAAVQHTSAAAPAATTAQALTPASGNVATGQSLAAGSGWGSGPEWTCLDELWTRESGWQMVWNTAGSGAYGIPQSLPASKMASAGADYMTNPATQIRWGLGDIATTYVTPCGAWAHEERFGWY
jgi:hypothetical protein